MLTNVGSTLLRQNRALEAEPLVREALAIYGAHYPQDHPGATGCRNILARILIAQARDPAATPEQHAALLCDAEELALAATAAVEAGPAQPSLTGSVLQTCVQLYEAWHALAPEAGHDADAARCRGRFSAWRAATQPAPP